SRRGRRRRSARAERAGKARAIRREEAERDRRAVRGDERARGRVLAVAGAFDGRGPRVAQAGTVRRWDLRGPRDRHERGCLTELSSAATEAHRAIEAIWRIESARLIAGLVRIVDDIGTAEELAQDALVAALEQWPISGVPERPGAWLMGTAKHRAIDFIRRRQTLERKHEEIERDVERAREGSEMDATIDEDVGDDLLGLVFMACHPVLSKDARVALTLRVLGGLTTEEIARGFLVPVPRIAQRIVRAKRTLAEAHARSELPSGAERDAGLPPVLAVP